MGASNIIFSIFSLLGFVLIAPQALCRYESWNTGSVLYIGWTSVMCITLGINAIIWNGNYTDWSPIWCDISSRIIIAGLVGIPASTLCINRRLYQILSLQYRRRPALNVVCDLCIGLGLPALVIVLYYTVQEYRYLLVEDIGCWYATVDWTLVVPLNILWAPMTTIASLSYSCLAIREARFRKAELEFVLSSESRSLCSRRLTRLILLSIIQDVYQLLLTIICFLSAIPQFDHTPWPGWDAAHENVTQVYTYNASAWQELCWDAVALYSAQWLWVFHAFAFVILVGSAREAYRSYALPFTVALRRLGLAPPERPPVTPTIAITMDKFPKGQKMYVWCTFLF
ncbi:fungal pheromone STE3G-protein-coupled receptor [Coniophora puteana RWD-64-598 SS2]|uniref:Fungal pheromone STE3G-protein-coupled receptor n=1 Tax=Coniophora puteana (strain RWD-64-598) TaxID=741705 RepID=A0A5M3MAL5_CONPW|nr:fungal pheromone STE3G-protein-coupled receptor [Coniophora puteana RWD-64-598 SS2]EIW76322.1 fungal pheromone STE3G-protein-coupled receptor [Coniophora puteana RWD-64-598 SS2]